MIKETGRDPIQNYDQKPSHQQNIEKAKWQHKNATKNFDYMTIKDWLFYNKDGQLEKR